MYHGVVAFAPNSDMNTTITLSHVQTQNLLQAHANGATTASLSPDLGLSEMDVSLSEGGVHIPDGPQIPWADIAHIAANPQACFVIDGDSLSKAQLFSAEFQRLYSLYPTAAAPTMLVSGITMHRIKDIDPWEDTRRKIKAIAPLKGRVLDTATGLGYTAIFAARQADTVTTLELDPAVLELARINPWSRSLFDSPNIAQLIGDSFDLIADFPDSAFDRILHDPPRFALAGHLFSADFYAELKRVLKPGGRLFHYVGDPTSKSGRNTTKSVARRLQEAGFRRVVRKPDAFGLLAY